MYVGNVVAAVVAACVGNVLEMQCRATVELTAYWMVRS